MLRLLDGDHELDLRSITIWGKGKHFEITDAETLRYLSRAFRSAVNEGYIPTNHGTIYQAYVRVGSFGSTRVGIEVLDGKEGINLGYIKTTFDDPTNYWIAFPEPRPAPVADLLDQLVRAGRR